MLAAAVKGWTRKAQDARKRAEKLATPSPLAGLPDENYDLVAERWEALTIGARKAAVKIIMPDLTLMPGRQGEDVPVQQRITHCGLGEPALQPPATGSAKRQSQAPRGSSTGRDAPARRTLLGWPSHRQDTARGTWEVMQRTTRGRPEVNQRSHLVSMPGRMRTPRAKWSEPQNPATLRA